jgi:hypothetical protein
VSQPHAALPPTAIAQHTAILGKTGSGKTSTGKLLVEQAVAAGARVCVLDPIKSDWWGLVSSADGKRPGLPFHVLGGPRGHVPLHSGAGAAIAELVASGKLPLSVLDMADFEPGGQHRFFVAFAETLLKRMRGALYLVLEEAHELAPKERSGVGGHENLSIHWAKKLATAGRSKGIRLVLLTQRTQALHNALLGSCETMIVQRLTAPADQKPVLGWLKANVQDAQVRQEIESSMASLKTGTGWLCSGEARIFERVQFPRISTFDNSATPTDDAAELHVRSVDVDLDALRALVGTAVQEAEANDPRKLKARIAELERQVAAAPTARESGSFAALEAIRSEAQTLRERLTTVERDNAALEQHRDAVLETLERVKSMVGAALESAVVPTYRKITNPSAPAPVARTSPTRLALPSRPAATPAPRISKANGSGPVGEITGPQQRILDSLAWWERIGSDAPEYAAVAAMADYSVKSSSFGVPVSQVKRLGLVTARDGTLSLTPAGRQAANWPDVVTGDELRRRVLDRLEGPQRRLLEPLLEAYPNALSNEELAKRAGYSADSSSYGVPRSQLKKYGFIQYRDGQVVAREILFP